MVRTIFITGASSGIGNRTARFFQEKGWNVIATMRSPENDIALSKLQNIIVSRLDVTDEESINKAVQDSIDKFGRVDVLLNNAGYGAYGPLEAIPMENIKRQFDTNVIGLLATTKALLPHFRTNGSGTIVNISSIGGRIAFPLGTLYHGSKFAVEGISEALHYELEPIGIKVKIIQPSAIATDFGGRSFDFTNDERLVEYQDTVKKLMGSFTNTFENNASPANEVAKVIWDAVTDGTDTLRYPAGGRAKNYLDKRATLDDATLIASIKAQMDLKTPLVRSVSCTR